MQMQDEQITGNQPEMQEQAQQPDKEKKSFGKELLSWIVTLGMAVIIAFTIRTFLFEPIRVDGESMCDTLQDGEIMLVTKPEYLFGDPQVGDVVVCHYPERGNTNFVKRVIGVPGDTITIENGVVYRNGEAVEEPYLTPSRNQGSYYDITEPFVLGDDEYFVCGDNRDNSHDSRNYYTLGWGQYQPAAVTRNMIKGHVRWVVFPFGNARGIE
ncbi:MAG: signal peptidase I [Clostridia bacterium]|nr:signal peptidase I [Clostridia bacterium]